MIVAPRPTRRQLLASAGALAVSAPLLGSRAARAADLPTVNIVNTQGITGLAIQEVASDRNYFQACGVNGKILNVSDGSKVMGALLGGASDICIWSGFNSVLTAIEKGAKVKILGGALLFPTHGVFTKNPKIQSVKDLVGKTIGVGALGAQLHQEMVALFLKKGIDPNSVTYRNIGSSQDVFKAIVAGTVDAGPSEVDIMDQAAKYGVRLLPDGKLWLEVPEFTFQASYASEDAIAKKRQELVGAQAAFGKTFTYVQTADSKDAFVKAYMTQSGKNDDKDALSEWNFIQEFKPYDSKLVLGPESIEFMQKLNVQLGVQKAVMPYEQVADMSLANEALALMAKSPA